MYIFAHSCYERNTQEKNAGIRDQWAPWSEPGHIPGLGMSMSQDPGSNDFLPLWMLPVRFLAWEYRFWVFCIA